MAYIRPCNKCGQRISMREMRAGQWVAFDVSTEKPHKCGKKNKADPAIKKLAKQKNKVEDDDSIDLGYESECAPRLFLLPHATLRILVNSPSPVTRRRRHVRNIASEYYTTAASTPSRGVRSGWPRNILRDRPDSSTGLPHFPSFPYTAGKNLTQRGQALN